MPGPTLPWVIGVALVTYGLLKVSVSGGSIFAPDAARQVPGIGRLVATDRTLAGMTIEVLLLAFGTYTLLHGLCMTGVFTAGGTVAACIECATTQAALYTFMGVLMTGLYGVVLYTDLPIQKDAKATSTYQVVGLVGGLMFLAMVPVVLVQEAGAPAPLTPIWLVNVGVGLALLGCAGFVFVSTGNASSYGKELIDLSMIPMNLL